MLLLKPPPFNVTVVPPILEPEDSPHSYIIYFSLSTPWEFVRWFVVSTNNTQSFLSTWIIWAFGQSFIYFYIFVETQAWIWWHSNKTKSILFLYRDNLILNSTFGLPEKVWWLYFKANILHVRNCIIITMNTFLYFEYI